MSYADDWSRVSWLLILRCIYYIIMFRRIFPQKWVHSYALWHSMIHLHHHRFMLKHGYKMSLNHPMSWVTMSRRFMTLYYDRNVHDRNDNDFDIELVVDTLLDPSVVTYYYFKCFITWKDIMRTNFQMNQDLPTGGR